MKTHLFKQSLRNQYLISITSIVVISFICYLTSGLIGYLSVALLLLATVSILAIFFTLFPVLVAATLSALIWDFFFIPPHYTLHIESSEDVLMLSMYFLVALLNGVFTSKIRQFEKLEMQKDERRNTLKLYKTLFSSISHELRTPLATIVGSTDNLLQPDTKLSDNDRMKLLNEISIAAFRLNRLVDNLLNMQRLESGFLETKLDWCEIHDLINNPVNRLSKELEEHHVKIDIDDAFPIIKLDSGLIEQAIFNILHNAAIYTLPGSEITITCKYLKDRLMITIADNGRGFSESELKNLFTKTYRVRNTESGGIGLGLSIAKGFIESHNGSITVENNIPSGAKISLSIPCESLNLEDELDFSNVSQKE